MTTGPTPSKVLGTQALKALSHPMRIEIYDILSQYGVQTASSLASIVGESSGVTSYHLRTLAKHELIREVPGRGSARERWWERVPGAISIGAPEVRSMPAGRVASDIVSEELYRRRQDQLMQFLRNSKAEDIGDMALLTTSTIPLTQEQFEDFSRQLIAVMDDFVEKYRDQSIEGTRRYSVRADVFPLPSLSPEEQS